MAKRVNVLVSGAGGFVGKALVRSLREHPNFRISCSVRSIQGTPIPGMFAIGDIGSNTGWSDILQSQNVVIHAAARVHIMDDKALDPRLAFREVNTEGTLNLARQAAKAGVRRFVFISSIKVNGEHTLQGAPFTADDAPDPKDAYALSKLEAERGLWQIARDTGMEIVVIRPPLVYGPGVKGNFASMVASVARGLPLPLGAVNNKRSLVALDNLVDLITVCIEHPAAANQVFLVSDGDDLSTSELLRRVGAAVNKPARLISVPGSILELAALLLGKKALVRRLLGSLQVDIDKVRDLLGWEPPVSVDEGLRRCCEARRNC
ncbi:UDP-glucose 4-epimerase family protein [Marinobacter goseongensis]|uniref:UDP-glucose 4-epimerase family protein n=1 Tax=Marinobacter goseongensis TaxID=453838 RepID=UPI0020030FEB|nr:SDR family oxidoreductase [Marinobacter goseongensis]MCK7551578.1 SDR family oxidoreductase [Marinobacter goseongensis]